MVADILAVQFDSLADAPNGVQESREVTLDQRSSNSSTAYDLSGSQYETCPFFSR